MVEIDNGASTKDMDIFFYYFLFKLDSTFEQNTVDARRLKGKNNTFILKV